MTKKQSGCSSLNNRKGDKISEPQVKIGDNNEMLEIKNTYTENMFFKEQLMRPGGLAA